jgi:hypothetical protein
MELHNDEPRDLYASLGITISFCVIPFYLQSVPVHSVNCV